MYNNQKQVRVAELDSFASELWARIDAGLDISVRLANTGGRMLISLSMPDQPADYELVEVG